MPRSIQGYAWTLTPADGAVLDDVRRVFWDTSQLFDGQTPFLNHYPAFLIGSTGVVGFVVLTDVPQRPHPPRGWNVVPFRTPEHGGLNVALVDTRQSCIYRHRTTHDSGVEMAGGVLHLCEFVEQGG